MTISQNKRNVKLNSLMRRRATPSRVHTPLFSPCVLCCARRAISRRKATVYPKSARLDATEGMDVAERARKEEPARVMCSRPADADDDTNPAPLLKMHNP